MKKNLYLKSCLMLLYALNLYLHPVYAQIEQGQFNEDDCKGFELESSKCMNTLNECFSCIMQRGFSFFDPEIPDGLTLLEHKQIIHYQRASDKEALDYQLKVDVQEYNEIESKFSLVAKAMWLAGESRRSQNCL